ncbi:MAG: hypothetical protein E5Y02_10370 [Mesorhizobium sp.]|nr:MAG: hypothetical protein E5Y02_10370 [Mesorhizobium sp.]
MTNAAATQATTFLAMFNNLEPVTVTQAQADHDLAQWQIARTIRMILAYDCAEDGSCIDDPARLWQDIFELLPDLGGDKELTAKARLLMVIAKTVERDRAGR